jgi:hypothetical protein
VALAREVHPRERLVERDRDVGVRLVVAQTDVVWRPVLLDEPLLGEQRLGLVRGRDELDPLDSREQLVGHARATPAEVRGDALADRVRLADVQRAAARVLEQVHPGRVGQATPLLDRLL